MCSFPPHEHRHADGFFVEDRSVSHEVVGKHAFAVVRGQDHERVFRRRQGVETIQKTTNLLVGELDFSVVERDDILELERARGVRQVLASVRLGRIVRMVGVVVAPR